MSISINNEISKLNNLNNLSNLNEPPYENTNEQSKLRKEHPS